MDIGARSVARLRLARLPAAAAELREDVGHLERRADSLGALVDARLGLLAVLGREDAERDRDAGLESRELEPARRLARDESKCGVSPRMTQPSATMQA